MSRSCYLKKGFRSFICGCGRFESTKNRLRGGENAVACREAKSYRRASRETEAATSWLKPGVDLEYTVVVVPVRNLCIWLPVAVGFKWRKVAFEAASA